MKSLLYLKPYFRRYRSTLLLGIFYILFSTVLSVIAPMIIREAIDGLSSEATAGTLFRYAAIIVGVSALSGYFLYLTRQTIIVVSRHIEFDLRNDFIRHVISLPQSWYQDISTGEIMAHATNDISAVRMFVGPAVMYAANTVFTFFIIVGLMLGMHTKLTLLSLLPLPFVSLAVNRLGTLIHKRFEVIQEHYADMTSRTQESISGVRVIKAYLREEFESSVFYGLSEEYRRKYMRMYLVQSMFMPLIVLLVGLSIVLVVYLGGVEVINGELTLGELTQFIIYLGMLIWPMAAIGWVMNLIQRAAASMKRLDRILQENSDITDSPETDTSITSLRGAFEFDRVSFGYDKAGTPIINDLSLSCPAGTTLAIIGYTGSGKSTLVDLLPRLHDVTGGRLLIDGTDIRKIPLSVLRSNIAYVTQETFLFSDSIENNISYGVDDPDPADIRWAAGISRIDKDVSDFPDGYDTVLGERGITLSGGQKQRVSLARAVMRKPSILILDDALSAVDTHTEEEILKQLKGVMADRSSIIISHRISTVQHADHIIVLDQGRIVQEGTHAELLKETGIYSGLYNKQLLADELEEIE